jgi:hypothetical protein
VNAAARHIEDGALADRPLRAVEQHAPAAREDHHEQVVAVVAMGHFAVADGDDVVAAVGVAPDLDDPERLV